MGFKVGGRGGEGLELTHLLIAIDNLIFYDANLGPLEYLSWTLVWFETILGLKINLEKSELLSIVEVANVVELAMVLGCKVGSLPSTYS